MKTINLIKPEKSEVEFRINRFPDGEVQFELLHVLQRKEEYEVECRITNAEELFILLQVGDILDRQAVTWDLHIRYLMGMRMDRVMSFERPFTLRIVGKMISQMGYRRCFVYSPHNPEATLNEIRQCEEVDYGPYYFTGNLEEAVDIVLPDRGACLRYFDDDAIEDEIWFDKERDPETGKIKSFTLKGEENGITDGKHFLLYDDLCDAGGTFLGELKILKEKYPDAKFDIRVAHIVNEVGLDNLCKNFDTVYTTESYRDWGEVAKEKGYKNLVIK